MRRDGGSRLAETVQVLGVRRAEALGDEPRQRRADRLLARAAEHLLGRLVEEHDVLALVHGDDRVHRRIEDAAQPRLAAREQLLGAHALGHVAQDHGEQLAAVLDVLRDRGLDGKLLAVGAQAVKHHLRSHPARGGRGGAEALDMPLVSAAETLRKQHVEALAEHRARGQRKTRSAAALNCTTRCSSSMEMIASMADSTMPPTRASTSCRRRCAALRSATCR